MAETDEQKSECGVSENGVAEREPWERAVNKDVTPVPGKFAGLEWGGVGMEESIAGVGEVFAELFETGTPSDEEFWAGVRVVVWELVRG